MVNRKFIPERVGERARQLSRSGIGLRRIARIIASEFGSQHEYSHTHIGKYLKGQHSASPVASSMPSVARRMPTQVNLQRVTTLNVDPNTLTPSLTPPPNSFPSSLTPQEPFFAEHSPAGWIVTPQDNSEFITNNYDGINLEPTVDSSSTIQQSLVLNPLDMLSRAMHSMLYSKISSQVLKTADITTNNLLGIPNVTQSQSNLNQQSEGGIEKANPADDNSHESMQSLVDRLRSIREEREKDKEKERLDTKMRLERLQEEISEQIRKNSTPEATDSPTEISKPVSADNTQLNPDRRFSNSSDTTSEQPGGDLQSQIPNVESIPSPPSAPISPELNGELLNLTMSAPLAQNPVVNNTPAILITPATNDVALLRKEPELNNPAPSSTFTSSDGGTVMQDPAKSGPSDCRNAISILSQSAPDQVQPDERLQESSKIGAATAFSDDQKNTGIGWLWVPVLAAACAGAFLVYDYYHKLKKTQTQPPTPPSAIAQGYTRVNSPNSAIIF